MGELDLLIDEIMLMSRLDSGVSLMRPEALDLVALVAEECARFEHCSIAGGAPEIIGDPNLLRRLVRNLLKNAVSHGAPPVEVDLRRVGDQVTVTVSDNGPGIGEESRDKVFQPFFRGVDRQNVEGYGLGLALVRQIAEAHGGRAEVATGGRFRSAIAVTLPISGPPGGFSAPPANGA
jgi:signal transduction histidine kinase